MADASRALPAWIFFDVGWTLVDETRAHLERFEQVRATAPAAGGLSVRALYDRYERAVTDWAPDPFVAVLETVGLTAADRGRFAWHYELTKPYRDAAPALRALQGVARMGVLANQGAGLRERLEAWWGLGVHFEVILGSGDVGVKKPDPRFFAMAAERAGCAPGDILYAGDRLENDVAPAKAAGWRTVLVRRGLHARCEPRSAAEVPDATVTSLTKLAALYVPADRLRLAEKLDATGAIMAWPEKERDKQLVLAYLAGRFDPGRDYAEPEVNALIKSLHRFDDHALLRRELVDRRLLSRDDAGRRYRRAS